MMLTQALARIERFVEDVRLGRELSDRRIPDVLVALRAIDKAVAEKEFDDSMMRWLATQHNSHIQMFAWASASGTTGWLVKDDLSWDSEHVGNTPLDALREAYKATLAEPSE